MSLSTLFSSIQEIADYANSHFKGCNAKNIFITKKGFGFTIGYCGGLGKEEFYFSFSKEEVLNEGIDVDSYKEKWKESNERRVTGIEKHKEKVDNLLQDEKVKEYINEFPINNLIHLKPKINVSIYNNIK